MGTVSLIGIVNADGCVKATYCAYDGYLEWQGRMLVDHYNDPVSAEAVASVGFLRSLETDLNESIAESNSETCYVLYYSSVYDYMTKGYDETGADFLYLYDGSAWFYSSQHNTDTRFEEVELNLKELK